LWNKLEIKKIRWRINKKNFYILVNKEEIENKH